MILGSWEYSGATDIYVKVDIGQQFRVEDPEVRYFVLNMMMDSVN